MLQIDKFRCQITAVCDEFSLARLDIVGAATRDDLTKNSDIDVLVGSGTYEGPFLRYFDLNGRLENLFDRPVDVIEERAVKNPMFHRMLEKHRVRAYGA